MEIKLVGVVGAGQMGNGIAHVFALAGYQVLMTDISEESLSKALATVERNIERQVSRGKVLPADKRAALERIKTTL
jgi:3-hydroxybutyryl-CoA dehydrogenase